jgi:signal transduction histidine kinase
VAAARLRHIARVPLIRRIAPARDLAAVLAGVSGCLLLVIWASPRYNSGLPPLLTAAAPGEIRGAGWWFVLAPIAATVVGLSTLRWWPYLLLAAALLAVPGVAAQAVGVTYPLPVHVAASAGYPLAVVGVLACAQGLVRVAAGWGAAVAGLTVGAQLFGTALSGPGWLLTNASLPTWHVLLLVAALGGALPAAWYARRGDPDAAGPAPWSWRRIRLVVAGGLVMCVSIPLSFLTVERLSSLLDVSWSALYRHGYAVTAIAGAVTLVAATVLAAFGGVWTLAGSLTAATARVALVAPMILAIAALFSTGAAGPVGALAGVAAGAVAAASRWRVPLAAVLSVLGAITLFIAHAATTGHPEKLAEPGNTTPALLVLVLITAAATAVVGATAPALAPRGAVPAALGPLSAVLAVGGLQTVAATYLQDGLPVSSYLNPVFHLTTSAVLLLVVAAAIGGLGFAQLLATRRAERRHAEQIRREAAAAERDRLARPIHDGVLQVLALVQRHGADLGGQGGELASLAAEQEAALRTLLSGQAAGAPPGGQAAGENVGAALRALATGTVEVAAPAQAVVLPAGTAAELVAAVRAALDNVRRHAGPAARAWVLLEDEGDAVRVTVRDDGAGFAEERLAEAAAAGRLGVAQSMRGRIADLGGTTAIHSAPGEGTEVEFWLPR